MLRVLTKEELQSAVECRSLREIVNTLKVWDIKAPSDLFKLPLKVRKSAKERQIAAMLVKKMIDEGLNGWAFYMDAQGHIFGYIFDDDDVIVSFEVVWIESSNVFLEVRYYKEDAQKEMERFLKNLSVWRVVGEVLW